MHGLFSRAVVTAGIVLGLAASVPAALAAKGGVPGPPTPRGAAAPVASQAGGTVVPAAAAARGAAPPAAAAANRGGSSSCPAPTLSRPFLPWGDAKEYTLLPGETFDVVGGAGWTLRGGAHLVSSRLHDGTTGQVLDMPAGSVVVTTPLCVNASNYPSARAMVTDVTGAEGVAVYVSYATSAGWSRPAAAGHIKNTKAGWRPSKPIMLHAGALTGMHLLRLVLIPRAGEYRLYNLFVDPRRGH